MRPYRQTKSGVVLTLRVTPNAARNEIAATLIRDNGHAVLPVRVKAPPDKGKANKAVISLLAKKLRRPKGAFSIVSGQSARLKTVAIAGEAAQIVAELEKLLG